jgi:hypothetical protein
MFKVLRIDVARCTVLRNNRNLQIEENGLFPPCLYSLKLNYRMCRVIVVSASRFLVQC